MYLYFQTHAYNNVEFRTEISEPCLCDFKSANIIKEENNVIVSLSFTPFIPGDNTVPTSESKFNAYGIICCFFSLNLYTFMC